MTRLRVARLTIGDLVTTLSESPPTSQHHAELQKLLRQHLSPITASLFAEPVAAADPATVDWFSDLAGQPVQLTQIPDPQRLQARTRLERRLRTIGALADKLDKESQRAAELLRAATAYPGDEFVYVIDGQPVLTFWGHRKPGASPPLPGPTGLAAAATGTTAMALDTPGQAAALGDDEGLTAGVEPGPRTARRWPWWLALAMLLGIATLFLIDVLNWRWPPWGPDYEGLLAAARNDGIALEERLDELEGKLSSDLAVCELRNRLELAEDEGQRLARSLDALADRLAEALALCPLRGELDDAAEATATLEEKLSALEERLQERLAGCRKAAEKKPAPAPKTPERTAETKKELPPCPGERPPEEAPDVAVVLDASGSMEFPVTVDRGVLRNYRLKQAVGVFFGIPLPGSSGPNRLDAAKRGIKNVVGSLPEDVDIGLVVLADCPAAQKVGFFSHSQRGRLNRLTDSLRPMRKTPLASGVEQAAQMVDGVNAPGVIVVISDGEDTCQGDPCAVARAMKARKPKLTINVVDILGDGASNCLAQATGGKVLTPRQGMSFEKSIQEAAEEAQKPAHCH